MSSMSAVTRVGKSVLSAAGLMACLAAPAAAQSAAAPDPNPGAITITGATDFTNAYMFRGIYQENEGLITWPYFDLGIAAYSGDGGLKSVGINFGTWNSLHTGPHGTDGPSGKLWYESDFYATLGLGFGGGFSLGTTYTAYTSPNNSFTTVKEIALKVAVDDSKELGKFSLKPYAVFAFEMDTDLNQGQADGGSKRGTYIELGVAPGYTGYSKASIAVPIKVGLSGSNYYELCTSGCGTADPVYEDNTFGYFSVAGVVTVPLGGTTKFGSWNIHGGAEFQFMGTTTKEFLGKDHQEIYSIGLGFSY
jgi:hypothetical protein